MAQKPKAQVPSPKPALQPRESDIDCEGVCGAYGTVSTEPYGVLGRESGHIRGDGMRSYEVFYLSGPYGVLPGYGVLR
jgi:hypothetical protein